MNEQNAWPEITSTLYALNDETLSDLLASSQQLYDGNYVILAEPTVYSNLCQYYPLIETVVQDHSGRHFRLNLQSSVPMGTDNEAIQIYTGAANITDAIISPETIIAVPSYLLRFVPYVVSPQFSSPRLCAKLFTFRRAKMGPVSSTQNLATMSPSTSSPFCACLAIPSAVPSFSVSLKMGRWIGL